MGDYVIAAVVLIVLGFAIGRLIRKTSPKENLRAHIRETYYNDEDETKP